MVLSCRQQYSTTIDNLSQQLRNKMITFVSLPKKQGQVLEVV
nr:MAG TPA: hypothetical protein [Caudoviricetes sp.]